MIDGSADDLLSRLFGGEELGEDDRRHLEDLVTRDGAGGEVVEWLRADAALAGLPTLLLPSAAGESLGRTLARVPSARSEPREEAAAFLRELAKRSGSERAGDGAAPSGPRRRVRRSWQATIGAAMLATGMVAGGVIVTRLKVGPLSHHGNEAHPVSAARPGAPLLVPVARPGASAAARLDAVEGTAYIIRPAGREPATTGADLYPQEDLITVGARSSVRMVHADGSTIDLGPDTVTSLFEPAPNGQSILVASGVVRATIAPQPKERPFVFVTPHGEAAVLGTKLMLSVSASGTKLEVMEGRVQLRGGRDAQVVAAGRQALLTQDGSFARINPVGGTALFVVGSPTLSKADDLIRRRLEKLGFEVKVRGGGTMVPADIRFVSLVLISSTVSSSDVNEQFRELPVPLITSEENLFEALAMVEATTPRQGGGVTQSEIVVKDPWHPLAAGLSNTVRVTTEDWEMCWGTPSPFATWIATAVGAPSQAVVFGYEKGSLMVGMSAPARRVGLFMCNDTTTALTEAGWALFDAAVRWAVAERKP